MQTVHTQLKLIAGLLLFLGIFLGVTSQGFATDLVATFTEFPQNITQLTSNNNDRGLAQVGGALSGEQFSLENFKGDGVAFAVIDSGFDYTLTQFGGCTLEDVSAGNCLRLAGGYSTEKGSNDVIDIVGHGTAVAAAGFKFAPNVDLFPYSILDSSVATLSQMVDAFNRVREDLSGYEQKVVNLSMGALPQELSLFHQALIPHTEFLQAQINSLSREGFVVVLAAGNSGPGNETVHSLAISEGVITVGASTPDGRIADFSSRGPGCDGLRCVTKPDLVAPGVGVCLDVSQVHKFERFDECRSDGSKLYLNGTSFSSPTVAGAAASLLSAYPDLTPKQVKLSLVNGAKPLINPETNLPYHEYDQGAGELDLLASFPKNLIVSTEGDGVVRSEGVTGELQFNAPGDKDIITCGDENSDCAKTFLVGTTVTLTGNPRLGELLTWEGCTLQGEDDLGNPTCIVDLSRESETQEEYESREREVTAYFESCNSNARAANVGGLCDGNDILALWVQFADTTSSTAYEESDLVRLLENVTDAAREVTDDELDLNFDLKGPFQVGKNFGTSLYASKVDVPQFIRGIDVGDGEFDFSRILREGNINLNNYKYLIVINDAPIPSGIERGKQHILNFFTNSKVQGAIKNTGKAALAPNLGLVGAVASKVDIDLVVGDEASENGIETFSDKKVIEVFPGLKNSDLSEQEDILLVQLVRSHNIGKSLDEVRADFEKITKVTDFVLDAEALMSGDILGAIEKGVVGAVKNYAKEKTGDLLRKTAIGTAALDGVDTAKETGKKYLGVLAKGAGGWLKQDDQIVISERDKVSLRPITVKKSINPLQKKGSASVALASGEQIVVQFNDATAEGGQAGLEMQTVVITTDEDGNRTPNFLSLNDDTGSSLLLPGKCYFRDNMRIEIPANAVKKAGGNSATITFEVDFKDSERGFHPSDCSKDTVKVVELTVSKKGGARSSSSLGGFRIGDLLELRVAIENPTFVAGSDVFAPTDVFIEIGTRGQVHTTLNRDRVNFDSGAMDINFEWTPEHGQEGWNEVNVRAHRSDDEVLNNNEIVQRMLLNVQPGGTIPLPVFNYYTVEFFRDGETEGGGTVDARYELRNILHPLSCNEVADGCPPFTGIPEIAEIIIYGVEPNEDAEFTGYTGSQCGGRGICRFQIVKSIFPDPDQPIRIGVGLEKKPGITLAVTEGHRVSVTATEPGSGGKQVHIGEGFSDPMNLKRFTIIDLSIDPEDEESFVEWSIPNCGSEAHCQFTLDTYGHVTDIVATFSEAVKRPLDVQFQGTGKGTLGLAYSLPDDPTIHDIECVSTADCANKLPSTLPEGTSISVAADPGANETTKRYGFDGWGGNVGCSGTADCTFTLDKETNTLTVKFFTKYKVTVEKTGNASGHGRVTTSTSNPGGQSEINCAGTCERFFREGSRITFSHTVNDGRKLKAWGRDCGHAGGNSQCVITDIRSPRNVTAEFIIKSYRFRVDPAGTWKNGSGIRVIIKRGNTTLVDKVCPTVCGVSDTTVRFEDLASVSYYGSLEYGYPVWRDFTGIVPSCSNSGCSFTMPAANVNIDAELPYRGRSVGGDEDESDTEILIDDAQEQQASISESSLFGDFLAKTKNIFSNLLSGNTRGLAQVADVAGPRKAEVYEISVSPQTKQVLNPVAIEALIANRKGTDENRPIGTRLEIQKQNGSTWSAVHSEEYFASNIESQSFVEVPFSEWVPNSIGNYRAYVCVGILKRAGITYGGCEDQAFEVVTEAERFSVQTGRADSPNASGKVTSVSFPDQKNFGGCAGSCTRDFLSGTQLTLEAVAESNFAFVGWVGADADDCEISSETANICTIDVLSSKTIKAQFGAADLATITVERIGSGEVAASGNAVGKNIDCGERCSAIYPAGDTVVLTPNPAPGNRFESWTGERINFNSSPFSDWTISNCEGSTFWNPRKAFDGDIETAMQCGERDVEGGGTPFIGLQRNADYKLVINKIRVHPRNMASAGLNDDDTRHIGNRFEGSNDRENWDLLATITGPLPKEEWTVFNLENETPYEFVRYVGSDGPISVNEIQFFGKTSNKCTQFGSGPCTLVVSEDETIGARFIVGETFDVVLGDVNGDGNILANDALFALRAAVGVDVKINREAADVNCDGSILASDALVILRAAVGAIPTPLTCPSGSSASSIPELRIENSGDGELAIVDLQYEKNVHTITIGAAPGTKLTKARGCNLKRDGTVVIKSGNEAINCQIQTSKIGGGGDTAPIPEASDLTILSEESMRISALRTTLSVRAKVENIGTDKYQAPLRATIQIDGDAISETHELRRGEALRILVGRSRNISTKTNWAPTPGTHTYTFCILPATDANTGNNCVSGTFEIDERGRLVGATTTGGVAALYGLGVLVALGAGLRMRQKILTMT